MREVMLPDNQKKLKKIINEEIKSLLTNIAVLREATKPITPDNAIGRLTRMDAINTKSINEANLRNAKLKLTKLERAIRQVNEPDFGYCIVCDEPIPLRRLMVLPESTMCIQCKEKEDSKKNK